MPYVKIDTAILNSTLWFDKLARDIFLTALLMAEPRYFDSEVPQLSVRGMKETGWSAPPSPEVPYGFVPSSGRGLLSRALVEDQTAGLGALQRLGEKEADSRSANFEGRRLIRIDGGFLVLNYGKYREQDYTAAERQRRYRERKKSRRNDVTGDRNVTQAEAEAEAEAVEKHSRAAVGQLPGFERFWKAWPKARRVGKPTARRAWVRHGCEAIADRVLGSLPAWVACEQWQTPRLIPHPSTFLNRAQWDDPAPPPARPSRRSTHAQDAADAEAIGSAG